jgi:hypothetical protein
LGALRGRLLFRLFGGHVMADGAAADRAQNAVMTGVVAGDAADNRALQAPSGLDRRRANRQCWEQSEHRGGDPKRSHDILLSIQVNLRRQPAIWVRP